MTNPAAPEKPIADPPESTEATASAGLLRIDFGPREERLEKISRNEFFEEFDEVRLAFLYPDETKDGKISRFHNFVSRRCVSGPIIAPRPRNEAT